MTQSNQVSAEFFAAAQGWQRSAETAERERDEANERFGSYAFTEQLAIEKLTAQRDEARAEVIRLGESMQAWISDCRTLIRERDEARAALARVEALLGGPYGDGYRPYAVAIDGDVILTVGLDDLRAALRGDA